jgi:hypothetical protein
MSRSYASWTAETHPRVKFMEASTSPDRKLKLLPPHPSVTKISVIAIECLSRGNRAHTKPRRPLYPVPRAIRQLS